MQKYCFFTDGAHCRRIDETKPRIMVDTNIVDGHKDTAAITAFGLKLKINK